MASNAAEAISRPYGRHERHADEPEPATVTYSRGLPSFGNPNQMPNPPRHYFPSIPASQRQRRAPSPSRQSPAEVNAEHRGKQQRQEAGWGSGSAAQQEQTEVDEIDEDVEMDVDNEGDPEGREGSQTDHEAAVKQDDGPVKKRSRTLTTAHQTAVLNALLAKTRFPSTETREEVGQQIGMSARRVQIWFQNRRQSQKRARDRDATEPGAGQSHLQQHASTSGQAVNYLSTDPYAASRYSSRPYAPRHGSVESLVSVASFASSHAPHGNSRAAPYARQAGPSYSPYPPPSQQSRPWSPSEHSQTGVPARAYAFPPPPLHRDDPGRRSSSFHSVAERYASPEPDYRLPPISSVLLGSGAEAPSTRQPSYPPPSPTSVLFAHAPPPLNPPFSPTPTGESRSRGSGLTRPFDGNEFARLRISGQQEAENGSTRETSPHDVLDDAMEMMYRSSRANPPRSSLPTLRSALNPELRMPPIPQRSVPSTEADVALLRPILKSNGSNQSLGGKSQVRLPPISSLSLASTSSASSNSSSATIQPPHQSAYPQPAFPPIGLVASRSSSIHSGTPYRNPSVSPESGAPPVRTGTVPTRSSISSFDTVGTMGTTWTHGQSISSSRTSFSSEVQDEWERASSALSGGMNLGIRKPAPLRDGSHEESTPVPPGLPHTPEESHEGE